MYRYPHLSPHPTHNQKLTFKVKVADQSGKRISLQKDEFLVEMLISSKCRSVKGHISSAKTVLNFYYHNNAGYIAKT